MFFKRKPAEINNDEVMAIFMDALVALASSVVVDQDTDTMLATLELDPELRVNRISNFTLNDQPQSPDANVIESINQILSPLTQLPESARPATLKMTFSEGGGDVVPTYND